MDSLFLASTMNSC